MMPGRMESMPLRSRKNGPREQHQVCRIDSAVLTAPSTGFLSWQTTSNGDNPTPLTPKSHSKPERGRRSGMENADMHAAPNCSSSESEKEADERDAQNHRVDEHQMCQRETPGKVKSRIRSIVVKSHNRGRLLTATADGGSMWTEADGEGSAVDLSPPSPLALAVVCPPPSRGRQSGFV